MRRNSDVSKVQIFREIEYFCTKGILTFDFFSHSTWASVHKDVESLSVDDQSKSFVSMLDDHSLLAIVARPNNGIGSNRRVHRFLQGGGSSWNKVY